MERQSPTKILNWPSGTTVMSVGQYESELLLLFASPCVDRLLRKVISVWKLWTVCSVCIVLYFIELQYKDNQFGITFGYMQIGFEHMHFLELFLSVTNI